MCQIPELDLSAVRLPFSGKALIYDAFENRITRQNCGGDLDGLGFSLRLSPYESRLILAGEAVEELYIQVQDQFEIGSVETNQEQIISSLWSIAMADSEQYPRFSLWKELSDLNDLSQPDALPAFSGTFRYETNFQWTLADQPVILDLGEVYETAEV